MDIQFESADQITAVFNGVVDLVPIIKMSMKPDGIHVLCLEQNNCAYIDLFFNKDDLMNYRVDKELDVTFDLKLFLKILSKMNKADPLRLLYKIDTEKINIIQRKSNGKQSKYTIQLIDIPIESIDIPEQKLDSHVNMSSVDLKNTFEKLTLFSETCKITSLNKKQVMVLSSNGDFGSGREEFPVNQHSKITDTFYGFFPLPYLIKFMKAEKIAHQVDVCMIKNKPLSLHFNFENSYLRFYLAPKVPDETDIGQQGLEEEDELTEEQKEEEEKKYEDSESEYEEVLVTDSEESEEED